MTNANEILKTFANEVETKVAIDFFDKFSQHYGLTEKEDNTAFGLFNELKGMGISLDLAINTAIALARI